jgi:hypothetical protein
MSSGNQIWQRKHLAVWILTFTLAIGPFFNGMFFEPVRLVGISMACVAYLLGHSDPSLRRTFSWTGLDGVLILWFVSYLIVSFQVIYPRGHLSVMLDLIAVLAVYFLVRRLFDGNQSDEMLNTSRTISLTLVTFGVAMVIITLMSSIGVPLLDRYFVDLRLAGRLSGGFQYPNTFAAWTFVLTMLLLPNASQTNSGAWARFGAGLLAGVFMMTLSRAGLLATIPAFGALVVFSPRRDRTTVLVLNALIWIPAYILGAHALQWGMKGVHLLEASLVLAAGLPPLLAPWAVEQLTRLSERMQPRRALVAAGFGLVLFITVVGGLALVDPLTEEVEPGAVRSIGRFSLRERNVVLRLIYNADALRIIQSQNYVGAGGQSWSRLYRPIQRFYYTTTETHNHFLQVGIEAGLLGLLSFSAIWVTCGWVAWRASRMTGVSDPLLPALASAIMFIGAHSFMDFNLSYISVLMLLALLLGMFGSRYARRPSGGRWTDLWAYVVALLCLVAIGISGSLTLSKWAIQAGGQKWAAGHLEEAVLLYRFAALVDPVGPAPWERLGAIYNVKNPGGLANRRQVWATARNKDPVWFLYALQLAHVAVDDQRWDEAANLAFEALSLAHMDKGVNEAVADLLWQAAKRSLEQGNVEVALQMADHLSKFRIDLEERIDRARPYASLWPNSIVYTPLLHLRIGQGATVGGRYGEAISHLLVAAHTPYTGVEAIGWLYLALERSGNKQGAAAVRAANETFIAEFVQTPAYQVASRH